MMTRPFFGLTTPKFKYSTLEDHEDSLVKDIPLPEKIILFLQLPEVKSADLTFKSGDEIKTGQRLFPTEDRAYSLLSSVTGTISDISDHRGYLGQTCPSVSIDVKEEDQWDDEFKNADRALITENALNFLNTLPGNSTFASLLTAQAPVDTIVINGLDKDLLINTNQLIVKSEGEALAKGIEYLKGLTNASRFILAVPPNLKIPAEKTGAEVAVVKPHYPNFFPRMIMKDVLGVVVPPGRTCESMGVGFINAEAVLGLTGALDHGEIPIHKMLTVIDKNNTRINVRARIGTPIGHVLSSLDIVTGDGDRIVLGGPMTGHAVYSEDIPVLYDTDAIVVQDKDHIIRSENTHCVNCGECVRVCPANIPVNMLIRYLENSLYEEASKDYDLLSCIECGLCSYVCISRIPIFHYIMLGKYEFGRIESLEESNG